MLVFSEFSLEVDKHQNRLTFLLFHASQTLCMHIMHHSTDTLYKYGPATSQWMYGFERFMAFLSGRIHNRKQPEATAIEAYRVSTGL